MKVSRRRHQMKVSSASLIKNLLKPLGRRVNGEILHHYAPVIVHFSLELALTAYFNRAHCDAERLAAAPHRLHYLHKTLAKNAGSDFFFDGGIEFEAVHIFQS
jgi:hypothetical protein